MWFVCLIHNLEQAGTCALHFFFNSTVIEEALQNKDEELAISYSSILSIIVGQLYRDVFRGRVGEVLRMVHDLMCTVVLNTGNIIILFLNYFCNFNCQAPV